MKVNKYNIGMRNAMLVQFLSMKRKHKKLELLIKQEKKRWEGNDTLPITNEERLTPYYQKQNIKE